MDFELGWFLDPSMSGHYPGSIMQKLVGKRLPQFPNQESQSVPGSLDFVGIIPLHEYMLGTREQEADAAVIPTASRHGKKIGEMAASSWLHMVPWGMFKLMKHVKSMDDANNRLSRLENGLQDDKRIQYHNDCMYSLLDATRKEGCNVQGYFVLDNWEWNSGYTVRFGLYYVDYNNNLEASAEWFSQILLIPEGRCLVDKSTKNAVMSITACGSSATTSMQE